MDKHPDQAHQPKSPGPDHSIPTHLSSRKQSSTPQKSKPQQLLSTDKSKTKFLSMVIDPPILNLHSKYNGCNCRKSQCLKMYCVCFSTGKMCHESCLCDSCHNKTDNMRRSEAINQIITKDPFAFSRADSNRIQYTGQGCNCKKSNCSKKYCECFRKGRGCGQNCNCLGCANPFKDEEMNISLIKTKGTRQKNLL